MPLFDIALSLIQKNLERIHAGRRPHFAIIGELAKHQLEAMNALRSKSGNSPMESQILFIGKHLYKSRFLEDGYRIDDILDQVSSSLHLDSIVSDNPIGMTTMQNPNPRADRYGNTQIKDQAVFECTGKYPRPELFSVIPKGDKNKPK
jgi:hypothetical protein